MTSWLQKALELLAASLDPPRHELNEFDWKAGISPDKKRLAEHLSAFANHPGGGFLVYGIGPDGTPIGIAEGDIHVVLTRITNLARNAVDPAICIDHAVGEHQSKRLLFVCIPESSIKPVRLRGSYYDVFIRSAASTRRASRQEIGSLMLHSRTPRWEELRASLLLTRAQLIEMLSAESILKMLGRPEPSTEPELFDWLEGEKFVAKELSGGGYVTNLGAISAARRIADFPDLRRKALRVIVYQGVNKVRTRLEQEGKVGYAIGFQGMLSFITSRLPQNEVIQQALRAKITVYPEIALREILANALIHQDFTITGAGPLVEIFDDRIEISNPGNLLPSKQLDRLIGTQPESRNELLARSFRQYKICEERGSGLLKAGAEIELYGLPPIEFYTGSNFFKVTLHKPRSFAEMSQRERLEACYQHSVLKYFSDDALTNASLRQRLKMPEKQTTMVSALIRQAVSEGRIKQADPHSTSRKFARYVPYWA